MLSCLGALAAVSGLGCSEDAPARVRQLSERAIAFPARVNIAGFEDPSAMPGYHAIVWKNGRAADAALFRAEVTDVQVLDALEALGAVPGNALDLDTWEERHDPQHPAPRRVLEGPPVEIFVRLPDEGTLEPLASLLTDPGGRGLEMRFGGHRENIPLWRSGCITCLYSCPGSKVGNARYTVRDFVEGSTHFSVKPDVLPRDGTQVEIVFRLSRSGAS